jgi:hypothetical protein
VYLLPRPIGYSPAANYAKSGGEVR